MSGALILAAKDAMGNKEYAALNAVDPAASSWVCVPFELPYGKRLFRGFMRLRYDGAGRRVDRLVADIRSGSDRRIVDIGGASPSIIRYHADDEEERMAFEASFAAYGPVSSAAVEAGDMAEFGEYPEVDSHA